MRALLCLSILAFAGCTLQPGATAGTKKASNSDVDVDGNVDMPSHDGPSSTGDEGTWSEEGVTVHLQKSLDGASIVSFGLPLPAGAVHDAASMQVRVGGAPIAAAVRETLVDLDASGARVGARAVVIQFPAAQMTGDSMDVEVLWEGGSGADANSAVTPFGAEEVSAVSSAVAETVERSIALQDGKYVLTESAHATRPLFPGREPRVLATFPDGYLARIGLLGPQISATDAQAPERAGLGFFSTAFEDFTRSSMYRESYALNPSADSVVDPVEDYSAWLYDRCATFLTAYTHLGDPEILRHAYQSCHYYATKIGQDGETAGIFTGKPERDTKYSHLRGLHAYYALTGDEAALEAGQRIAEMWYSDDEFVGPYRQGHTRGIDKLWTERLLGTSMEGLYYGHRLTGDPKYLTAFQDVFETAYRHVTGDSATLAQVNPGTSFPPQGCFIHTGEQHADAGPDDPWCSPWMSAMVVDALLAYQEQTEDSRVDEMFVQLARFLRDVGTSYFTDDLLNDSFLAPSACDNPGDGSERRRLVPLYGAGLRPDGSRATFGEYDDWQHCADASALTAVGLRALRRQGLFDGGAIGPFATEGESLLAMHHELSACAERGFQEETRLRRDPAAWSSEELAAGASDPATFIEENRIGFPLHKNMPMRRISWWFNVAMLQFRLLSDAGVTVPELAPGAVQPAGCP